MDRNDSSGNKTFEHTEGEEISAMIDEAIQAMRMQLKTKSSTAKVSVADVVRLLQLRKELEGDQPRKVSARWIDEWNQSTEQ